MNNCDRPSKMPVAPSVGIAGHGSIGRVSEIEAAIDLCLIRMGIPSENWLSKHRRAKRNKR